MKKLLTLIAMFVMLVSCKKETIEPPIVGCRCYDGATIPGSDANVCGTYKLTTNGVTVTLTHGGLKEYIRSDKTFCQLFGGSIYCLGQNY